MRITLLLFAVLAAAAPLTHFANAADLSVMTGEITPGDAAEMAQLRHDAASNLLALELVRVTFDVRQEAEVLPRVAARMRSWGDGAPSAEERDEIARQLLAEGSYYLTGLSYLIQVGGAVFPRDRAEAVYAADLVVRLDALQRQLGGDLAAGREVAPLLMQAEAVRALTEGYATPPEGFGPLAGHAALLEALLQAGPSRLDT